MNDPQVLAQKLASIARKSSALLQWIEGDLAVDYRSISSELRAAISEANEYENPATIPQWQGPSDGGESLCYADCPRDIIDIDCDDCGLISPSGFARAKADELLRNGAVLRRRNQHFEICIWRDGRGYLGRVAYRKPLDLASYGVMTIAQSFGTEHPSDAINWLEREGGVLFLIPDIDEKLLTQSPQSA